MNSTATRTGFEALAIVHPNHVERITAAAAALTAGTVVTLAVEGTDCGTFFTGVKPGENVVVSDVRGSQRTVQIMSGDAAHLSVNSGMTLTAVDPNTLTADEAKSAQAAATKYATGRMEAALCSANGLLGAPAGDEAALTALRDAHDLRNLAFAYGVLADWITGLATGDSYHRNTLARCS